MPQPVLTALPHCEDSCTGWSSDPFSAALCVLGGCPQIPWLDGGREVKSGTHSLHCLSAGLWVAVTVCLHIRRATPLSQLRSVLSSRLFPWSPCPSRSGGRNGPLLWRDPGQPAHSSEVVPSFHFLSLSFGWCQLLLWEPWLIQWPMFKEHLIMSICREWLWPLILPDHSPDSQDLHRGTQNSPKESMARRDVVGPPDGLALRIQMCLDKEKRAPSGRMWNEVDVFARKCFLIKCCWSYDMKR